MELKQTCLSRVYNWPGKLYCSVPLYPFAIGAFDTNLRMKTVRWLASCCAASFFTTVNSCAHSGVRGPV